MFNIFEPTGNVLVWRITGSKTFKNYNKDHLHKYLAIIQVGDESPLSQGYNPLTKGIMTTVAHRLFVTVLEWWRRSPDPALSSWHLRRMWAIRILCEGFCCLTPDSRLVGSSKRVPIQAAFQTESIQDLCFLRQRKPTSSPKNVEENLLNSYNLTPCNRFSHLRTEVEYVGKELLNSSWKAPGWWLCWWHASPANSKHQARELAVLHTENSPPEISLVKTWRNLEIPVSDLHCPEPQLCTQSIDTTRCEKLRRSHRQSSASWLLPALHRWIHSHHPN